MTKLEPKPALQSRLEVLNFDCGETIPSDLARKPSLSDHKTGRPPAEFSFSPSLTKSKERKTSSPMKTSHHDQPPTTRAPSRHHGIQEVARASPQPIQPTQEGQARRVRPFPARPTRQRAGHVGHSDGTSSPRDPDRGTSAPAIPPTGAAILNVKSRPLFL